jgi:hypothetical protein
MKAKILRSIVLDAEAVDEWLEVSGEREFIQMESLGDGRVLILYTEG